MNIIYNYKNILDQCKKLVTNHIKDDKCKSILNSIEEQKHKYDKELKEVTEPNINIILSSVKFSAFIAGIFSFLPPHVVNQHDARSTWYHVHNYLFDTIEENPKKTISKNLLYAVEVLRGEICEAYRLVRFPSNKNIPEECELFFESLDTAASLLANYFNLSMSRKSKSTEENNPFKFRSKYSGSFERYPIDVRTCVTNDIRRYFPGSPIKIADKIIQTVQSTYLESIKQIVPEDAYLISGLLQNIPSLAFALRVSDFKPENLIEGKTSYCYTDTPSWGYAWTVSLSRMFFSDDGKPNDIAKRVHDNKYFGPFELIDGILDSMSKPWGHANQSFFIEKMQKASSEFFKGNISLNKIINKIKEQSRIAQTIDPCFASQQLGLYLDDSDKIRLLQLSSWSLSGLIDSNEEAQDKLLVRGNIIQRIGPIVNEKIEEFEWLLEQDLPESKFQKFLEQNPFLLASLGPYVVVKPHVILHEDSGKKLIPDFFLELGNKSDSDIIELKLPDVKLDVRNHNRDRLSHKIHVAVAQLREYRSWFNSSFNRNIFTQNTGMKCFRPRAIIIIGRSSNFQSDIDRLKLESTLPEWISLKTYDDLLTSARSWNNQFRLK